jgi:MFS transporter, SP family, galactose:H+ symporter
MSKQALTAPLYNTSAVWRLAVNASWGSFVFGYNIGVFTSSQPSIAAALGWGGDKELLIMLMAAMMPFGAMFGALGSGVLARRLGRRKALMLTDLITLVGVGAIVIPTTPTFAIGRFVTGVAAGSFASLVPLYINEVVPTEIGGKVGGIVQFQVTFGIVIAYALALALPTGNYKHTSLNNLWIGLYGFQAIFVLIQLFMYVSVYRRETPNWLMENMRHDMALDSLREVYCEEEALKIVKRMENEAKKSTVEMGTGNEDSYVEEPTFAEIIKCKNNLGKMIRLGCMLNFFQQFSGINAILTFGTTVFASVSSGTFMARIFTLIMGIVNMVATLSVFPLIEKTGRKRLIVIGGAGMAFCLFLMGFFSSVLSDAGPIPPILFIMLFIVFFEASLGPVCWIYCGEILPAQAMSICVFINWFSAFIVILTFQIIVDLIGMPATFFVYAALNGLGVVYFFCDMVETKGLSKMQIRKLLLKKA